VPVAIAHAERAPNLVSWLAARGLDITTVDLDDDAARNAVIERRQKVVIALPEDFGQRLASARPAPVLVYSDGSRAFEARAVARVKTLVMQYGQQIGQQRLLVRGIDPLIGVPLAVQDIDVSTPTTRSVLVLSMLSYLVIMSMLVGGLYLAIDATAGERERGSLEPLLTTPIPRANLIYGKILAAAAYMLVSLILTVAAFAVAVQFIGLERFGMSANLGPLAALTMIACCAPIALLGAAFLTIIAAFAKSYREAQSYLSFVIAVPTLPLVFAGMFGLTATTALMLVPFLSQHLLITSILRAEPIATLQLVVSVVSTLGLGVALAWIAGRLYNREALLS
ncbi:MAG: ABC transporter permease, partial [Pseudomonadales bacterium]|nr:ABC transporter permease [Pseudomonadales bacterium]